jgi:formylglycine-generating enzyme required for sulfatase activity
MKEELDKQDKPDKRMSLLHGKFRGGRIALGGFKFQDRYALIYLLESVQEKPDFVQVALEKADDVEGRFDTEAGARYYQMIQVKNHEVKTPDARGIIKHFRELDERSPGTWTSFVIVCRGLDPTLRAIHNALKDYRRLISDQFHPEGFEPLADTHADVKGRIEKAKFENSEAEFVIERVYFEPDRNYNDVEWVESHALGLLQKTYPIGYETAQYVLLRLCKLLSESIGGSVTRRQVEEAVQVELDKVEIEGLDQVLQPFEPETVLVDAGQFLMGCDEDENEAPQHPVTLDCYWIGKYPVTNAEFAEFVRQTGRSAREELGWGGKDTPPDGILNHPVRGVTFSEAKAYCTWLAEYTTRAYRLPTEAEWEKAARGTDGRTYPWGNDWEDGRCNHGQRCVTPVDAYPAQSAYGCYDMVGNTAEWTHSLWGEKWIAPDPDYRYPWKDDRRNNPNDNTELRWVCRGGSHLDEQHRLRCSARNGYLPDWLGTERKPAHGFRVARSL